VAPFHRNQVGHWGKRGEAKDWGIVQKKEGVEQRQRGPTGRGVIPVWGKKQKKS